MICITIILVMFVFEYILPQWICYKETLIQGMLYIIFHRIMSPL